MVAPDAIPRINPGVVHVHTMNCSMSLSNPTFGKSGII